MLKEYECPICEEEDDLDNLTVMGDLYIYCNYCGSLIPDSVKLCRSAKDIKRKV